MVATVTLTRDPGGGLVELAHDEERPQETSGSGDL